MLNVQLGHLIQPNSEQTYARYAVRLKRADTKKALKDFLLYGKPSNMIQVDSYCLSFNNHKLISFSCLLFTQGLC